MLTRIDENINKIRESISLYKSMPTTPLADKINQIFHETFGLIQDGMESFTVYDFDDLGWTAYEWARMRPTDSQAQKYANDMGDIYSIAVANTRGV